jgi:tetratricopeptide (TPR) repeat protein
MHSRSPSAALPLVVAVLVGGLAGCGEERPSGPDPEVARLLGEAASALHSGQPGGVAQAAELYRAALARNPGWTEQRDEARFGLAQAEVTRGRRWAGQWSFVRLAHESPGHAGALSAVGILAYEEDRYEDTVSALESLSRLRPLRRDEVLACADAARRTNRFELADSLFSVHLSSTPEDVTALEVRAWVRRKRGDLNAAEADLASAVRVAPHFLPVALSHAEVLFDLSRNDEARAAVAAIAADGFAPAARGDSARATVLQARIALEDGDARAALRLAVKAAAQDSTNLDALQMQVRAQRALGDLAAARAAGQAHRERMRELEDMDGAMAFQRMIQGALALEKGDSTAAFEALQTALREDPDHLSSHALLAPLARDLGRRDVSRASFTKLREASGGAPPGPVFLAVGQELRRRGFPRAAASQFRLAAARLPGDEEPVFFGALALLEAGDEAGAYATAAPLEAAPGTPGAP